METQTIDPRAAVGHVHLTVRDLPGMRQFYEEILGFREAWSAGPTVFLSADGLYPFHLGLTGDPNAARPGAGSPGLYHAAFLLPTRGALGRLLQRLIAERVRLEGFSDHLVSEAIYLHDPEGNGLELYADRPRDRWRYEDGRLLMSTEPLNLEGLLAEAGDGAGSRMDPATRLGHVHLRVSNIDRAEKFYHGVLGFDVTVREYPGALFLSAGGYHHHIGMNVWESRGGAPAQPGSAGLRYFTITLPGRDVLEQIVRRAGERGVRVEAATDHGLCTAVALRDEDGIGVTLTVDRQPGRVPAAGWRSEPRRLDAILDDA